MYLAKQESLLQLLPSEHLEILCKQHQAISWSEYFGSCGGTSLIRTSPSSTSSSREATAHKMPVFL